MGRRTTNSTCQGRKRKRYQLKLFKTCLLQLLSVNRDDRSISQLHQYIVASVLKALISCFQGLVLLVGLFVSKLTITVSRSSDFSFARDNYEMMSHLNVLSTSASRDVQTLNFLSISSYDSKLRILRFQRS